MLLTEQITYMDSSTVSVHVMNSSLNDSDFTVPPTPTVSPQQDATKYVVVVLYLLTSLVGMSGNSLTIFVLVRNRRVRSVATCFILNLAVADNLFIACLPFMAYSTYTHRWVFGDVICRLMNAFLGVNLYASIFTMTLMSFDRYLAVVHPLRSIRYRTSRNALAVCAVIWVVSFIFVIPLLLYSTVHRQVSCQVRSPRIYTVTVCQECNMLSKFRVQSFIKPDLWCPVSRLPASRGPPTKPF